MRTKRQVVDPKADEPLIEVDSLDVIDEVRRRMGSLLSDMAFARVRAEGRKLVTPEDVRARLNEALAETLRMAERGEFDEEPNGRR